MHPENKDSFESSLMSIQDLSYMDAVAQFDRLWQSATSEQDQSEMKRLIALIELYEADQKTYASSKFRDDRTMSGHYRQPDIHSKGESS